MVRMVLIDGIMKTLCHIVGFVVFLLCIGSAKVVYAAENQTYWIEVPNGNTSILYKKNSDNIRWIKESCEIKIKLQQSKNKNILQSEKFSKNVQVGNQVVKVEQQFKLDLDARDELEIYSSIRGGWFAIPIIVHETCKGNGNCQSQMGRPACPS